MSLLENESLRPSYYSFNKFITWYLDDRSLCLDLDGDYRAKEISRHLTTNFELISQYKIKKNRIFDYEPKLFRKEDFKNLKDERYTNLIFDIYDFVNIYLSEYISSFILHGSLATFDFSKGWSDVDTFVVIKNSTLFSPEKLFKFRSMCLKLKNLIYKICPLKMD